MTNQTVLDIPNTDDWEDVINLGPSFDRIPLVISGDTLEMVQSGFFVEGEDTEDGDFTLRDGSASDFTVIEVLAGTAGDFNTDYRFEEWVFVLRNNSDQAGFGPADYEIIVEANGVQQASTSYTATGSSPLWEQIFNDGSELRQGNIEFDIIEEGFDDRMILDAVALYDATYIDDSFGWDETVDSNGYLDDPDLFAPEVEIDLEEIETSQPVTEVEISSDWNDTSNNQRIEVTVGNETKVLQNTSSGTVEFDTPEEDIEITLVFSGYGSGRFETPTENFLGQDVSELVVDVSFFVEKDARVRSQDGERVEVDSERTRLASISSSDKDEGIEFEAETEFFGVVGCTDREESTTRGVGPDFVLGRVTGGDSEQSIPELLRVFVPGSIQPGQDREGTTIRRVLTTEDFIMRFQSIGQEADITVLRASTTEEYGKQARAEVFVFRDEWEEVVDDVDKINEEVLLVRDGLEEFRGRLVSYDNNDDEVKLTIASFEEDALDAEPTGPTEPVAGVSDEDVVENAVDRVDTLSLGQTDELDDDVSFLFSNSSPAKMIREVQRSTGAFVRYTNDKFVEYLESLGEDKTGFTPIGPAEQNVSESFTVKEDEREEFNHVRVLGASQGNAQITAETVSSEFNPDEDRVVWRKYSDAEITDEDRAQKVADSIMDEYENEPRTLEVETTIFDREVQLGDRFSVVSERVNIDRDLRVVKVRNVFQGANTVHQTTLSNRLLTRLTEGEKQRRDVEKFNEGFEGDVVTLTSGGYRAPVDSGNSYVVSVRKPADVVGELSAELEVEGLSYRSYSQGGAAGGNHSHEVELPFSNLNHSHSLNMDGHSHSLQMDGHSHSLDMEGHDHEFEYEVLQHTHEIVPEVEVEQSTTRAAGHTHDYFRTINTAGPTSGRRVSEVTDDAAAGGTTISTATGGTAVTETTGGTASQEFFDDETTTAAAGTADVEHTHEPEPGIIEFPSETPSNVSVVVNGTTVETGVGDGEFTEVVDIGGLLEEGFNRIEIESASLGHVRGTVAADYYRQITID